jgi:hypothetical protein
MAARALKKRPPVSVPALEEPTIGPELPFAAFALSIGDVVQAGDETRWPDSAIVLCVDGQRLAAVLFSEESGARQATVAFAAPERHLYWLLERDIHLPPSPPSRLEVDGCLLDREKLLSVTIARHGGAAPPIGASGRLALYRGTVGDVAVVLQSDQTYAWYGPRLAPDEYERLGTGDGD